MLSSCYTCSKGMYSTCIIELNDSEYLKLFGAYQSYSRNTFTDLGHYGLQLRSVSLHVYYVFVCICDSAFCLSVTTTSFSSPHSIVSVLRTLPVA